MSVCAQCGAENPPEARLCQKCGTALPQLPAEPVLARLITADGAVYPLSADSKIGSGSECQVVIAGADEFHAEITYNGMDWILYRRSNGEVSLNDQPVGSFGFLRDGDRIQIGQARLTLQLAASPNESAVIDAAPADNTPARPAQEATGWVPAAQANDTYQPPQTPPQPIREEDLYNVERSNPARPAPIYTSPASGPVAPSAGNYNGPTAYPRTPAGTKNRYVAAILAIFLGSFGAHRFYLGQTGWGVLYLVFFWAWVPGIIGIVEGIMYLTMSDADFARKYG